MRPVNPSEDKDNRNLKPIQFPKTPDQHKNEEKNPQKDPQVEPPGHEVEIGEKEGDFPPDIKMNQIDEYPLSDSSTNHRAPARGPEVNRGNVFADQEKTQPDPQTQQNEKHNIDPQT